MAVDMLGQRQLHAHEHGRPDDRVEAHDLLADKMHVRRPVLVHVVIPVVHIAQRRHVVKQRVHPDIDHVAGVKVHGDAPGEAGAADAQILQARLDEVVDHFVHTGGGLQEVRALQQILHAACVLAQPEEVGLLLGVLHLAAAVGALAVHQLALGPEGLAGLAVLAHVLALIDVTLFIHLAEDLLDRLDVIVVRGADEAVVGDVHQLPQIQNAARSLNDVVDELLGRHAGLAGLVLDLLTVLVRSGQEHHVAAGQAFVARHRVGRHRAVGVADVQLIGGIVDGGGDIKLFLFHGLHFLFSCRPRMKGRHN